MDKAHFWLSIYATCRQAGDDHNTACKNASDAINQCDGSGIQA